MNRRRALGGLALCAALPNIVPRAMAAERRTVKVLTHANVSYVHVPGYTALQEIFPRQADYTVEIARYEKLQTITQLLIAGQADLAYTDTATVIAAVAAGARLSIVGQLYASTDYAFIVNPQKIRSIEDFARGDVMVGLNATGDITHAVLLGILQKHKIDLAKVNVLGLGGSSSRMRALLSGRVHCVPIHIDQADTVAGMGNFPVLIKAWQEYSFWSHEVWAVRSDWLENPANRRVGVDLLKSQLLANQKADSDIDWFIDRYRKYSNLKEAADMPRASLERDWKVLREDIRAWPVPMTLPLPDFNRLIPLYEQVGILKSKASFDGVVDDSLLRQAQQELKV